MLPLRKPSGMRIGILHQRLLEVARAAGFTAEFYGQAGDYALPCFTRAAEGERDSPGLYLSAGIHGDEPAGPMALLEMLRRNRFHPGLNWTLLPLLNPLALERGTREHPDGIDLNRDYGPRARSSEIRSHMAWLTGRRFDLALCLHEDYETEGAYLYELKPKEAASRAAALIDAMRPWTGIEMRPFIDEMPNHGGLMDPPLDRLKADREDAAEALKLILGNAPWVYTTETPSMKPIADRIGAQIAVIESAARLLLDGAFAT